MKIPKILLSLMLLAVFSSSALAAANIDTPANREYFQEILLTFCQFAGDGCSKLPNPRTSEGAKSVLDSAIELSLVDNSEKIKAVNKPLESMGIEGGAYFIPKEIVEYTMCKYFGYGFSATPELQSTSDAYLIASRYYNYCQYGDPGIYVFEVKNITMLQNGVIQASGLEEDTDPFKAFFKKVSCAGKEYWVLVKLVRGTAKK